MWQKVREKINYKSSKTSLRGSFKYVRSLNDDQLIWVKYQLIKSVQFT